jgi:hypothetical protein
MSVRDDAEPPHACTDLHNRVGARGAGEAEEARGSEKRVKNPGRNAPKSLLRQEKRNTVTWRVTFNI